MSYTVTVLTTTEGSEIVSEFLVLMGAEGVCIRDKKDVLDLIQNKLGGCYWDYIDESVLQLDDKVQVIGYLMDKPDQAALDGLQDNLDLARSMMPVDMGELSVSVGENTDDNDWLERWKVFYRPIAVGDLMVVPAWQQSDADHVVKINPGTAFGTGEHESTQMCLSLLQTLDVKDKQIIDVGCGSGILGMAALKLGAAYCYFADIDPDAIKNMRENAALNELQNYEAHVAGLLDGCDKKADIMLANITADILKMLSKDAGRCLNKGGYLIASGIIAERADEVLTAFAEMGFEVLRGEQKKDWRAYLMRK